MYFYKFRFFPSNEQTQKQFCFIQGNGMSSNYTKIT